MNRSFKPCLQTSTGSIIQDPQPQYERLHGAWAPRILGSMDPGLCRAWAPQILGSVEPGLCRSWAPWILGSVEPGLHGSWAPQILGSAEPGLHGSWALWSLGSMDPGLYGSTGLHGSTDSADPQAPWIHNSTIQLFYIKIIMSTENHPKKNACMMLVRMMGVLPNS